VDKAFGELLANILKHH